MRSRVIPGSLVTIERREPVSLLKIVYLPTLGRPTITTEGSFSVIFLVTGDTTNPKREARNLLVYPTGRGNRSFTLLPIVGQFLVPQFSIREYTQHTFLIYIQGERHV